VIFDVDGILVQTKSGVTFHKSADDWQLLLGQKEKLAELKIAGVRLEMPSNQGGVAFGFLDQREIMLELHKTAKELGIPEGGIYVCYDHPKASIEQYKHEDNRSKPQPGMLLNAMFDFESTLYQTLIVGDRERIKNLLIVLGVHFVGE
jgi:HAD superfamily hydrolase (TIGR01662 family)